MATSLRQFVVFGVPFRVSNRGGEQFAIFMHSFVMPRWLAFPSYDADPLLVWPIIC